MTRGRLTLRPPRRRTQADPANHRTCANCGRAFYVGMFDRDHTACSQACHERLRHKERHHGPR